MKRPDQRQEHSLGFRVHVQLEPVPDAMEIGEALDAPGCSLAARPSEGSSRLMSRAMMEITTRSSISVNPRWRGVGVEMVVVMPATSP